MTCPNCGGDGGGESTPHSYNPVTGEPITRWQVCYRCDGKGEIDEEIVPRTLDDIEQEDRERPKP